jgi:hypothetical protein
MSRVEQITRKRATESWRVKTAGAAAITAGFCSTIGALHMQLELGASPIIVGFLPTVMLIGVGTILAGLLFTRGMQQAAGACVWLTMLLSIGGAMWNTYAYETIGLFPISIAAVGCSLVAFILTPMAWMEIRQIRRRAFYAVVM